MFYKPGFSINKMQNTKNFRFYKLEIYSVLKNDYYKYLFNLEKTKKEKKIFKKRILINLRGLIKI